MVVGGAVPAALSPMLRLQLLTPYVKKWYDLSAGIWLAPESTFRVRVRARVTFRLRVRTRVMVRSRVGSRVTARVLFTVRLGIGVRVTGSVAWVRATV